MSKSWQVAICCDVGWPGSTDGASDENEDAVGDVGDGV